MKLMQQHSSNVNVQGQPPEKKLRVNGGYTNGDSSNFDYQVKYLHLFIYNQNNFVFF
jgi:hypothetical protein